jgi:RNA polymerase sigma-70 factor (ECF subfamily)
MTAKLRTASPPLRVIRTPPPQPTAAIDPSDLDALYRRFAPYVAAVAMRLLGRDGEVDDLVQDVFLNALRGISQLRDVQAIRGWLAKVTVRLAVRRLRKRRLLAALQVQAATIDYERLAGPDTSAEQKAVLARIYSVLDGLPARTRVIWILRHVLDEPLHAIVELSACSQSTVQRRLRDAESLLAKEFHHG